MFWDIFFDLCAKKGKKPSAVAKEIGLSDAITTKWKNGAIPKGEILINLSNYFDCSVDYLLGRTNDPQLHNLELPKPIAKYEDCYVAFLDIIGFKDFVNNGKAGYIRKTMEKITYPIINSYWNFFGELENFNNIKQRELHYNFFSDSIVLSIQKDVSFSLYVLLFTVCDFLSDCLINDKMIIRGAITEGEMYCKKNDLYAFGKAMNESYNLQEKKAVVPRVILAKELYDNYMKNASEIEKNAIECITKKEPDGYLSVDYLADLLVNRRFDKNQGEEQKREKEIIERIISDNLEKHKNNEHIRNKYIWLNNYYNSIVKGNYINDSLRNFSVPNEYLLTGKEKSPSSELTDQELRALTAFRNLSSDDRLIEIGRMESISERYTPEEKEKRLG